MNKPDTARINSVPKDRGMRRCPDCLEVVRLHRDYPSSFTESLLKSIGIIKVKRCPNCNAAVFVVLGLGTATRRTTKMIGERVFWVLFILLILTVGFVVFEAAIS